MRWEILLPSSVSHRLWAKNHLKSNSRKRSRIVCQSFKKNSTATFPDINAIEKVQMTLDRNPFCCTVDDLLDNVQENILDLINNTAAKEDSHLQQLRISDFWAKMLTISLKINEFALKVLISFSSTYLCESGFSSLLVVKSKTRKRLDVEADLQCALSHTTPRVVDLVSKKQVQHSH